MVEIIFDELVKPALVEVALEGCGGAELLQVHEHEVRVEAGLAVWGRTAQLGGRVDPLPAPERPHVRVGLLRAHGNRLPALLHLLKDLVQVPNVVLRGRAKKMIFPTGSSLAGNLFRRNLKKRK